MSFILAKVSNDPYGWRPKWLSEVKCTLPRSLTYVSERTQTYDYLLVANWRTSGNMRLTRYPSCHLRRISHVTGEGTPRAVNPDSMHLAVP